MKKNEVTDYIVLVSIPDENNAWRADLVKRDLCECSFNYVIMHSLSPEELKKGARIVKVWQHKKSDEGFLFWDRIV